MIEYKGTLYPTRVLQVKFLEDNLTQDIIVATADLQEKILDTDDVVGMNLDSTIYFYMEPEDFFKAEITELDQPIEVISEDTDVIQEAIVNQMDDWNLSELFDYHIEQELLDEDECVEDYLSCRPDLLDESKEHRENEVLPKLSLQELLDRYRGC